MFQKKYIDLFTLNHEILNTCFKILDIDKGIQFSSEFLLVPRDNIDLKRDFISPKNKHRPRLDSYFNFSIYDQVFSDQRPFEPNLSILDLIFCLGPEAPRYLANTIRK